MNLTNAWKQFFLNKLDDSTSMPTEFQHFATHLKTTTKDEKYIDLITRSAFKCFAFVDTDNGTVNFCHHYTIQHDGWNQSHDHHVALLGWGPEAQPITFTYPLSTIGKMRPMPTNTSLISTATSKEHLQQLTDKTNKKGATFIPLIAQIPPFLLGTLLDTTTSDAAELFFISRTNIHAYTHAITHDLPDTEKAKAIDDIWNSCIYFLQYLWVASTVPQEIINAHTMSTTPDALAWSKSLHQLHIHGTPNTPHETNPPPTIRTTTTTPIDCQGSLTQATASLLHAASALTASTDRLVDNRLLATSTSTVSSKAWEKQPPLTQAFVFRLMARHMDDEHTQPTDSLVQFLSLSNNTSAALQFIKNYLHATLHCQDIRMDNFMVLCLSQFSLDYELASGPGRLSLFMMFDPATSLVYSTNEDIIDQATVDASGEYGMNYDQFRTKVSEKKTLWAPLNVNDFQTTFRNMQGILLFLFGNCFASEQVGTWATHIEEYRTSYKILPAT
jgi:hypothetical protein